jgi:hypothetical protein
VKPYKTDKKVNKNLLKLQNSYLARTVIFYICTKTTFETSVATPTWQGLCDVVKDRVPRPGWPGSAWRGTPVATSKIIGWMI